MIDNFLLIIGAMKSGTTSLSLWLAQHPQIALAEPKEPNFFAKDHHWEKGSSWYNDCWNFQPNRHEIALEATTCYSKIPQWPNAARRIEQYDAEFRFVYLRRDPVEQIESHLTHGYADRWYDQIRPLSDRPEVFHPVRYATQLAEYYHRFPDDRIRLFDFHRLCSDPESIVKEVFEFAGVDPEFRPKLNQRYNTSDEKYRVNYVWHQLRKIKPLYQAAVDMLPQNVRDRLREFVSPSVKRVELNESERQYVAEQVWGELVRLEEEFEFSTGRWEFSAEKCRELAGH